MFACTGCLSPNKVMKDMVRFADKQSCVHAFGYEPAVSIDTFKIFDMIPKKRKARVDCICNVNIDIVKYKGKFDEKSIIGDKKNIILFYKEDERSLCEILGYRKIKSYTLYNWNRKTTYSIYYAYRRFRWVKINTSVGTVD